MTESAKTTEISPIDSARTQVSRWLATPAAKRAMRPGVSVYGMPHVDWKCVIVDLDRGRIWIDTFDEGERSTMSKIWHGIWQEFVMPSFAHREFAKWAKDSGFSELLADLLVRGTVEWDGRNFIGSLPDDLAENVEQWHEHLSDMRKESWAPRWW